MADGNNLKDLLNSGNTEELRNIRDLELRRYQTNKIILDILKSGINKKFDGSTENLIKCLKILRARDYIKLDNELILLGLDNLEINLSYTEKKFVKIFVTKNIKEQLQPLLEYVKSVKQKHTNVLNLKEKQIEIFALEQKRHDTMLKLMELKRTKLLMLKSILDIKLSPYIQKEVELMSSEYRLNQQKIILLNNYIAQEFVSRSEYTDKAVKEIVKCLDSELEN